MWIIIETKMRIIWILYNITLVDYCMISLGLFPNTHTHTPKHGVHTFFISIFHRSTQLKPASIIHSARTSLDHYQFYSSTNEQRREKKINHHLSLFRKKNQRNGKAENLREITKKKRKMSGENGRLNHCQR